MLSRITAHAATRMAQRGFRNCDLDLVQVIGTPIEGGYLITKKDVKATIHAVERLQGARIVVGDGGRVVTIYRPSKKRTRNLLRSSEG